MAIAINTSPDPEENELEEPEDACLRRELGLRPRAYSDDSDSRKDIHPDQRPCPSLCWVGQHETYGHTVDYDHPMEATPNVVARPVPGLTCNRSDNPHPLST